MRITSEFAARIRAESYIDCRGYRYFVIDEQGFKKLWAVPTRCVLAGTARDKANWIEVEVKNR
nr:MAG TPA: hypothetical protein [Caudoviricetes sp.]